MRRLPAPLIAAAVVVLLSAGVARGHVDDPHDAEPPEEPMSQEEPMPPEEHPVEPPMDHPEEPPARSRADLVLIAPDSTSPGGPTRLEAVLVDEHGTPVEGAVVEFVTEVRWGQSLPGEVVLATAVTDALGRAVAVADLRAAGEARVTVRFAGDERLEPALGEAIVAVAADTQVYRPDVGIEVPYLTVWWLVGVVVLVWFLFLLASLRVFAIARAGEAQPGTDEGRRRFLGRFLVPTGMVAVVASLGSGLVALIARSPRTHGNLGAVAEHAQAGHRVPPVARLGAHREPLPLPPLLGREVSFSGEVLPLLMAKGGPHTHQPKHSPPPHGVRLDGYDHIMGMPGLVVPGRPDESRLVTVLLDPAMRMPPSLPPLPEEEIQLIASWVAQGARDN